jgi:hypothetical protein
LPEPKKRGPRPPPPAEWFWQNVDATGPARKPMPLPVAEAAIVKTAGAAKLWTDLPPEGRERLKTDGVVVVGSETEPAPKSALSFGAFYTDLGEQRVPMLLTLDALFAVARLGVESALAQAEEDLAATVEQLLTRLDQRLAAESKGANATLSEAYRVARGLVGTARALSGAPPAADIAPLVNAEKALVEGHAAVALSPVLGLPIDYSRFVVPSAAGRPGTFRALSWLGSAPFPLLSHVEAPGSPLDTAQTRTATRATMLIARLCDVDIDPQSNALYTKIARYLAFVWGPSDDLTLFDLDDVGTKAGVDLTKPEHIIDVAKVDKVRLGTAAVRAPLIYDGTLGRTARVFGGHASPDAVALEALLSAGPAQEAAPPSVQRDGRRVVPSTLDIAVWLGAPGARAALRETHTDAFEQYESALAKLLEARAADDGDSSFHSSVYGSLLAAVGAPYENGSPGADRARIESLLTAWTEVRHIDQPFARPKYAQTPHELKSPANPPVVLVEDAPEAIARLIGAIQQARRGLEAIMKLSSPTLAETEDILRTAAKGEATMLPARIAKLEEDTGGDTALIASVVTADPPSRRVLATATGRIEPILVLTREVGKDEPVLVAGAHIAHHELVSDAGESPTDATWRAKAAGAARGSFTTAFRLPPPKPTP